MNPIQSFPTAHDDEPYFVQYHEYAPQLPNAFEKLKQLIESATGVTSVEHVGSSSIPGVGGRNVLDVVVPVAQEEQHKVKQALLSLGFEDAPFPHYLPLLVGQIAHKNNDYPILLYVVAPEAPVLKDWIEFRDYMRSHTEAARAYDATKRDAVASGKVIGDDYQDAKTPFILGIVEKLRQGEPDEV